MAMARLSQRVKTVLKIVLTVGIIFLSCLAAMGTLVLLVFGHALYALPLLLIPAIIPMMWIRNKKKYAACYCAAFVLFALVFGINLGMTLYEEKITIDVTPNIRTYEYLPFTEDSKIVKLDSQTLKLTENLPVIDGATAAFPVYSAFVNAVYPDTTELYDGVFEYHSTDEGYEMLAEKKTDIFIGAQPSKEQIEYAKKCGTTFEYTQIGWEAFVFIVHKDNPIETLTPEQIRGIYSGEITNWNQVGGRNTKIEPFQRDAGSGSQSMMLRFMGDTPIVDAEVETVQGMGGMVEGVVDYQNKAGSIGYSFRYYIEGIVQHPDIKMLAVDGVAPTVENIVNHRYPIVAPVFAVTYAENTNQNVDKLIDWMLSEEGQYIIEEIGYVGMGD